MSEQCGRCGSPAEGVPKGKGALTTLRLHTKAVTMRRHLRITMFRFAPWTENPADQVRATYSDLPLCQACVRAVFTYATTRPSLAEGGKA